MDRTKVSMFRIIFYRNKLKIKQKKLNCYQKFSRNTDDSGQPRDLSERINIKIFFSVVSYSAESVIFCCEKFTTNITPF